MSPAVERHDEADTSTQRLKGDLRRAVRILEVLSAKWKIDAFIGAVRGFLDPPVSRRLRCLG